MADFSHFNSLVLDLRNCTWFFRQLLSKPCWILKQQHLFIFLLRLFWHPLLFEVLKEVIHQKWYLFWLRDASVNETQFYHGFDLGFDKITLFLFFLAMLFHKMQVLVKLVQLISKFPYISFLLTDLLSQCRAFGS